MSLQPGIRHDPHASVQVDRLQQRFVCTDTTQAAQLSAQWTELSAAWQDSIQGVDDALQAAVPNDPEEWVLIPRVQVLARWRPEAPTSQWGQDWWQAVGRAVDDCVQAPQAHAVLRYRRRSLALADLLYRSALGDTSRQWAWQCMGLIPRATLSPDEALHLGWALLCRQPAELGPVLQSLLRAEPDTGAWTAVLRRLRASDWPVLRAALPGAWARLGTPQDLGSPMDARGAVPVPDMGWSQSANQPLLVAWHAWVRRQPLLVARWASGRDGRVAGDALAALLGAWCWPWAQPSEVQSWWTRWREQVFLDATRPGPAMSGRQVGHPTAPEESTPARHTQNQLSSEGQGGGDEGPARGHDILSDPLHDSARPPQPAAQPLAVPELPQHADARHALLTAWAGACFWLGRLPQVWPMLRAELSSRLGAAHPGLLQAEALVGGALADALGVPANDPVARLWRGDFGAVGDVGDALADPMNAELDDVLRHTARQQVQDWAERLWADLGADDLATPTAAMHWLVHRPATLRIEPGWVEVCFEHTQVDTRIRRLALDLDPGWVPWCQAVVRFRYA